ncbi:MAG: hypothetical protein ABIH46_09980 [Chloroflexota bacterium]
MFYDCLAGTRAEVLSPEEETVRGLVVLNPAESKRLIAKAVAALPEVKRAMKKGRVIISRGTTNAFVAEEILGETIHKVRFAAGIVSMGELGVVPEAERLEPQALVNGKPSQESFRHVLQDFDADDVFIKGANAVDMWGNAGILVGNEESGTIGSAWPILTARGSILIVPVGLEKLIPSVIEAAAGCGTRRWKYCMGTRVGFVTLTNAQVVTEIQALEVLAGVVASHVASGGIGGSEGAVVLALEGSDGQVSKAFELVKSVKGEVPVFGI